MTSPVFRIAGRILLVATFAVWFGGFFFYTAFVVPTGTDVLGSSFDQGMITRRVTTQLNQVCLMAIVVMLAESCLSWRSTSRLLRAGKIAAIACILAMWILLVLLHPAIDALIDHDAQDINDYERFYNLHRAYLWASTFQWLAAWCWLATLMIAWGTTGSRATVMRGP